MAIASFGVPAICDLAAIVTNLAVERAITICLLTNLAYSAVPALPAREVPVKEGLKLFYLFALSAFLGGLILQLLDGGTDRVHSNCPNLYVCSVHQLIEALRHTTKLRDNVAQLPAHFASVWLLFSSHQFDRTGLTPPAPDHANEVSSVVAVSTLRISVHQASKVWYLSATSPQEPL